MKEQSFQQILEKELGGKSNLSSQNANFSFNPPLETPILELGWDLDFSFQARLRKKATPYVSSMSEEMRQAKREELRREKVSTLSIDVQVAWMNLCDRAQEAQLGEWEITEAKSLFRRLALKFHPDHCQNPNAVETFRLILADYNTIEAALSL